MPASGAPLGTTPFGYGEIATYDEPPGLPTSLVRKIDVLSRDYVIDEDAREFERMPKAKQRIYLALLTLRGSSPALPRMGVSLPKKLDASSPRRIQASVRDALRQLVNDGSIIIRRIDVAIHPENASRTIVGIEYFDTTLGRPDLARTAL